MSYNLQLPMHIVMKYRPHRLAALVNELKDHPKVAMPPNPGCRDSFAIFSLMILVFKPLRACAI